jgi:ATP-dependent DNA helicase RecQ
MDKFTVLKEKFGFDSFRPGQEEIIDAIMDTSRKGVLIVASTGFGKSILFQVPALLFGGLNVVISPLISLMQDQVQALQAKGIRAEFYNSALSEEEKRRIVSELNFGIIELLYIAPERFEDENFIQVLSSCDVSLFAIDEVHCISQYGDFRPAYRRLKKAIATVNPKQVVALTATATARTQEDICIQLGLETPRKFIRGFYRDNLAISVTQCTDIFDRVVDEVLYYQEIGHHTGIVYCSTRKDVDFLGELFNEKYCIKTKIYHAGLSDKERKEVQEEWITNGGNIVATSAMGMGIDLPNIRYVIHTGMTGSIEDQSQQWGRSGRDFLPSFCKLFTNVRKDIWLQNFFINMTTPPPESVKNFWEWINGLAAKNDLIHMTQEKMGEKSGVDPSHISGCISVLKASGLVELVAKGKYTVNHHSNPLTANINYQLLKEKRKIKLEKLDDMIKFINNDKECRQLQLLKYFDDKSRSIPCGSCDVCIKQNKNKIK